VMGAPLTAPSYWVPKPRYRDVAEAGSRCTAGVFELRDVDHSVVCRRKLNMNAAERIIEAMAFIS
jgi:hypothetical protein